MPLISVIVPVYKVEPYIHRCVDSILAQTFTDFELILVDDGSPDNCGTICDEYAEKDTRVHVIHQENGGLSAARNAGIDWVFANSDSQWISFIDSDDWVHYRYLELLFYANSRNHTKLSQCRYISTDGTETLPEVSEKSLCVTTEEEYTSFYSAFAWGKLYENSIFNSMRYPVGILYEDVTIWYKILFSFEKVSIVDETLYYYFSRPDSIVNCKWTPANLARIKAWDAQLRFFKSYGNRTLLNTAVRYYCRIANLEYDAIKQSTMLSKTEKRKYLFLIREKLRRVLLRFYLVLKNNKNFRWYLEIAFPHASWCYWTFFGVYHKMRKLIGELILR